MNLIRALSKKLGCLPQLAGEVARLRTTVTQTTTRIDDLERRVNALEGKPASYECRDWRAWHDRMPGSEATLHVTGTCSFPTSGYRVKLGRHEPQGINPRILLLRLAVTEPTGPVSQVVTEENVRYDETTSAEYDSVTILPDGPTIDVQRVT